MAPDERAWNGALREWFFRDDLAGRPAYLAVDAETLAAIAREHGFGVPDATESLCSVVRSRVSPRAPLGWWTNEGSRWRRAGSKGDPPFLTVLAVAVLAATIVDEVSDRSYYRRLNSLLSLPGVAMPRDFDSDIQQLWTYLNEWLTDVCRNRLGSATATNVGGQANVGWAQSQTLLRPSDRVKLPHFFTALGAQPGQLVDGDLLLRRLRSWSASGQHFSRRLTAVLEDSGLSALLAGALHSELAHWDGTVRDEAGRVALRILIAYHERSGRLQAVAQISDQLVGTTWRSASLEAPVTLAAAGELQMLPLAITSQLLDGAAIQVTRNDPTAHDPGEEANKPTSLLTLVMQRRDVHLLCPDDRIARWLEVPSALLLRTHVVLVRVALAAAATEIMVKLGGEPQPVRRIHCPSGWTAFRFTPAAVRLIDGPLAALSPRGNELSTLDGGLPVSRRRRVFLTAGAPDLLVDLSETPGLVTVDNTEVRPDAAGRVSLIGLRLGPGEHEVSAGGVHYKITLLDEYAEAPRPCQLAFTFDVTADGGGVSLVAAPDAGVVDDRHEPHDVMVSGAALSASPLARVLAPLPQPPQVRAGGHHFALGRPGQAAGIRAQPPGWMQALPLAPHLIDADAALTGVPFRPEWLLRVSRGGISVSAVPHVPGTRTPPSEDDALTSAWSHVVPYILSAVPGGADAEQWRAWMQAAQEAGMLEEAGKP